MSHPEPTHDPEVQYPEDTCERSDELPVEAEYDDRQEFKYEQAISTDFEGVYNY